VFYSSLQTLLQTVAMLPWEVFYSSLQTLLQTVATLHWEVRKWFFNKIQL